MQRQGPKVALFGSDFQERKVFMNNQDKERVLHMDLFEKQFEPVADFVHEKAFERQVPVAQVYNELYEALRGYLGHDRKDGVHVPGFTHGTKGPVYRNGVIQLASRRPGESGKER